MGSRWPLHSALAVIGGKWKLIAVMRVKDGVGRFLDLRDSLPGISHKQLTKCLRELERDGVIVHATAGRASERRYVITPLGAELQDAANALYRWGDLWLDRDKGG